MISIPLALPLILTFVFSACVTKKESFIPPTLESQIDWTISFEQIKESPSTYQGSVVIVGGEVLLAKRFKDHTRLIVLELPLSPSNQPATKRTQSEGRFIAQQSEFLDPATVPPGTRVTVVGEVSGSTTEWLDEMKYNYPILKIKHLEVWPSALPPPYMYGPYLGYPYSPPQPKSQIVLGEIQRLLWTLLFTFLSFLSLPPLL